MILMWYYKAENGTCSQIEVFMANYAKGMETKQKLILFAYEKLKTQSASNITVRDLAHESGYAASALYRYFGSLEHLLAVASVGFWIIIAEVGCFLISMLFSGRISFMLFSGGNIPVNLPMRWKNTVSFFRFPAPIKTLRSSMRSCLTMMYISESVFY